MSPGLSAAKAAEDREPPSSRTDRATRRFVIASMNPTMAGAMAVAAWAVLGVGDYLTRAEIGFTLLYLAPIGFAVWTRGFRFGLVVCALSTASALATELGTGHSAPLVMVWNVVGEVGVFVAFAFVLRRLKGRLDSEVSHREMAVEQLRHADRLNTVGKLASGIAHELGTPLNVVAGRAAMIASRQVEGEEARTSAAVIVQQTERMTAIIKNLLAFARRGGAVKVALDVSRLVKETASLLEPLAKTKGCTLLFEPSSPYVAPVNPGELQQVMSNVVMNAVQATPSGGTVRLWVDHVVVARSPRRRALAPSYVQIHIRDEGTGIPAEVMPHIFDPFFTTKDVGVGTGLGLSVTFGIVQDHGGWIEVSTVVGEGTEFVVFLPQDEVPVAAREEDAP